ncbi:TPA: hypothetical protein DDW35_08635, partial [Candidatus Sumerlaeota bacterium]|nr:hypothetical protein [Candidatus Sumerlaeota bacterium]
MTVTVPPNTPLVYAIVLNWNGEKDTIETLESLARLEIPEGVRFETLVVDNASRAESVAAIRAAFPQIEILQTGANLGYAGGNNVGIQLAQERGADWLLVLNNDIVADPPMLRQLLDAANADPALAILGPRVYRYEAPEQLFYTGWVIDWAKYLFYRVPANPTPPPILDVAWVQGCALMVRADFVRAHGAFDERYHLYCEDADWCVRAQRAGFRTVEITEARLWHKGYASSGKNSPLKTYYGLRNRLLFIDEHAPQKNKFSLRWRLLLLDAGAQALRATR